MSDHPTHPIRRFRLFRFSLKTLLIFMLLSGIYFGVVIPKQQRGKRESDAIKAIRGLAYHGQFLYDYQLDESGNPRRNPNPENPTPVWIQKVLGEYTFSTVKYISLEATSAFPWSTSLNSSNGLTTQLETFRNVEVLNTKNCFSGVQDLQCLSKMKKLRKLSVSSSNTLQTFAGIENCKRLHSLTLDNVSAESFEPLGDLSELSDLTILHCREVKSLAGIANHKNLKNLEMRIVPSVTSLDFLAGLENLESLSVCHALALESFDLGLIRHNKGLTDLRVSAFNNLANLQSIGELSQLKSLHLEYSNCEFSFSDIPPGKTALTKLKLHCCHGLQDLNGVESFDALEEIEINWCSGLKNLDALANLPKLKSLKIRNLPIDFLPELENLPELVHVEVYGLLDLKNLDGFASLKAPKLDSLLFEDCPSLTDVQSLASLHAAKTIRFKRCAAVDRSHLAAVRAHFPDSQIRNSR